MKILFLGIGKTKHKFLIEGIERYKKLLSPFSKVEEKYLKEESKDSINTESEKLIRSIPANYYKILLDIEGKKLKSENLAKIIQEHRNSSTLGIVFIIGGSDGVNDQVRKVVDLRISFSGFTMTHQMIRLFLSEQIYRAYTIITNKKYHK
ncbi:MAG: 23S rRNA (pseudouridine(1915)-N(3))-methyltransferase RlmH [Candidatus Delongbacteria bacterium]|nr:23S rRNA (pseudouridine(1915)-N(3))-methyltransferase RlmH [Candidatus Delongbacteria bacterium]